MKRLLLLLFTSLLTINLSAQQTNVDDRGFIVKIGDNAPDFKINYLDGTVKKLSDLKGKTVMLQFTASWCGVCRAEMTHIEKDIWLKHKGNDKFVLIGIDLKEDQETTAEFAKTMGITYPLTLDQDGGIFYKFAEKGAGVTRNVIIDKNGKIVFTTRLFNEKEFNRMKDVIEELLAEE